jgi:hypothetical protein
MTQDTYWPATGELRQRHLHYRFAPECARQPGVVHDLPVSDVDAMMGVAHPLRDDVRRERERLIARRDQFQSCRARSSREKLLPDHDPPLPAASPGAQRRLRCAHGAIEEECSCGAICATRAANFKCNVACYLAGERGSAGGRVENFAMVCPSVR